MDEYYFKLIITCHHFEILERNFAIRNIKEVDYNQECIIENLPMLTESDYAYFNWSLGESNVSGAIILF